MNDTKLSFSSSEQKVILEALLESDMLSQTAFDKMSSEYDMVFETFLLD